MPAWRMPPPSILRTRCARSMSGLLPTSTVPAGVPSPFERHTDTLSNPAHRSRAGVPSFTTALKMRAPSRWVASLRRRASATASAMYARGSTLPEIVFSSASSRVMAKCASWGLTAPSISARSRVPSGRFCSGCGWMAPSTAMPPPSYRYVCASWPTITSSPRAQWLISAARFDCVPEGKKRPASMPNRSAHASCRRFTVGSSANTSSPTSARAIASRMAGEGCVTVSLRRSIFFTARILGTDPVILRRDAGFRRQRAQRGRRIGAGSGVHRRGQRRIVQAEAAHGTRELRRFAAQLHRGAGHLLHQAHVVLGHGLQAQQRLVHLLDAPALLARGLRDLADQPVHLGHPLREGRHRRARVVHEARALAHVAHGAADERVDLLGGVGGALREAAHLGGHDREAAALVARPRGLDGGVEREDVGLERDALDHADDVHDAPGAALHGFHGVDGALHEVHAASRARRGGLRQVARPGAVVRRALDRHLELVHAGGRLLQRARLLLGALA